MLYSIVAEGIAAGQSATSVVDHTVVDDIVRIMKMRQAEINLEPETADQSCRPRNQVCISKQGWNKELVDFG